MKFICYKIGNRIAIKTIKENKKLCKITHFTFEKAKKVILNILKNGWTVEFLDNSKNYLL